MIKRRNVALVAILFVVTLGIYGLVWLYQTSDELIRYNKQSDSAAVWLIWALIPGLNLVAIWWYAKAVARMTRAGDKKGISAPVLFLAWLLFLIPGLLWSQIELNKRAGAAS